MCVVMFVVEITTDSYNFERDRIPTTERNSIGRLDSLLAKYYSTILGEIVSNEK